MAVDFPKSPQAGDYYQNPTTGTYYQYDGDDWSVFCLAGQLDCDPTGTWENKGEVTGNTTPGSGFYWRLIPEDFSEWWDQKNSTKLMLAPGEYIAEEVGAPNQIFLNGTAFLVSRWGDVISGGHNSVYLHGHHREFFEDPAQATVEYKFCDSNAYVTLGHFSADQKRQDDQIIELEEEIEALAPSLERGHWNFNILGTVAQRGQFTMYDGTFGNGAPTNDFSAAKSIWLNPEDDEGNPHGFGNVEAGNLIEIFDEGRDDFGLFEVVEVHDETGTGTAFWAFDVNFVRSGTGDIADGRCRFKIFQAPSGGSASEFVLKSGDEMSGELNLSTEQADAALDFSNPPQKSRHLRFTTKRTDTNATRHAYIFQPGYSTDLIASGVFRAKGSIHTTGYYYAGEMDGTAWKTYNPRIYFQENSGGIYYGGTSTSNRRYWVNSAGCYIYGTGSSYSAVFNAGGGELNYTGTAIVSWGYTDNRYHMTLLKGLRAPTSNGGSTYGFGSSGQVLKTNGTTVYWGTVSTGTTITDYVKDKNNKAGSQITIEYSGGNYFISGGN